MQKFIFLLCCTFLNLILTAQISFQFNKIASSTLDSITIVGTLKKELYKMPFKKETNNLIIDTANLEQIIVNIPGYYDTTLEIATLKVVNDIILKPIAIFDNEDVLVTSLRKTEYSNFGKINKMDNYPAIIGFSQDNFYELPINNKIKRPINYLALQIDTKVLLDTIIVYMYDSELSILNKKPFFEKQIFVNKGFNKELVIINNEELVLYNKKKVFLAIACNSKKNVMPDYSRLQTRLIKQKRTCYFNGWESAKKLSEKIDHIRPFVPGVHIPWGKGKCVEMLYKIKY